MILEERALRPLFSFPRPEIDKGNAAC